MGILSQPKATPWQKVRNASGFAKSYNLVLFIVFGGAMLGFTLAKIQYLDYDGIYCNRGRTGSLSTAAPGECFWLGQGKYKVGMIIHLAGALPAGFLAVFQFIPAIRYKAMIFHRITGYVILALFTVSTAAVFIFVRHSQGGTLDTQVASGLLAIMSLGSMWLAYYNVKKLQIDQHRAWMLRGWLYSGSIITVRIIMFITARIASIQKNYFVARSCAQLDWIYESDPEVTLVNYPECVRFYDGTNRGQQVAVNARFGTDEAGVSAALGIGFGMAMFLALAMHAIGAEVYLHLTPREAYRLRLVSYKRQLEAGIPDPGSAGLTVEKLGDADPWVPARPDTDSTFRFSEAALP